MQKYLPVQEDPLSIPSLTQLNSSSASLSCNGGGGSQPMERFPELGNPHGVPSLAESCSCSRTGCPGLVVELPSLEVLIKLSVSVIL